tara:strand:+ start:363 stop:608 length:246 start_codon:yes stop_codon:yes gene_type:complete
MNNTSKGLVVDNHNDIEKIIKLTDKIKKLDKNNPKRKDLIKQIEIILRKSNKNISFNLLMLAVTFSIFIFFYTVINNYIRL